MKLVFTTLGVNLDSQLDPSFGRARNFLVYDLQTQAFGILSNKQNLEAAQGAGIQSAQNHRQGRSPRAHYRALRTQSLQCARSRRHQGLQYRCINRKRSS